MFGHVVWGQELVAHLATGRPYDCTLGAPGAPNPGQLVPTDPVGTWRAVRATSTATLTPPALARVVALRRFGQVPLETFVTALITDFLAHTWDIATAAGREVHLDPTLVPGCLDWAHANIVRGPGAFGTERTAAPDADEQTRLLAFLGRRALARA